MPRTIIGLDISEDTVTAVQVKSLMQGYQVIGCAAVPITAAGGIRVALRAVCEEIDPKGSACNSVIEDGHVSFRNLSMPFTDLKKIRQTLVFELETLMASSLEKHLVDFIDVNRSGSQTDLIAATVNRAFIAEHLAKFEEMEVAPEILDVRNLPLANQLLMQPDSPENGMLRFLKETCPYSITLLQADPLQSIASQPARNAALKPPSSVMGTVLQPIIWYPCIRLFTCTAATISSVMSRPIIVRGIKVVM